MFTRLFQCGVVAQRLSVARVGGFASAWTHLNGLLKLGGLHSHYSSLAPPETREHGRKRLTQRGTWHALSRVASGVAVRGGNPRLTRGVRPALENHRKSLDHYSWVTLRGGPTGRFVSMPRLTAGFEDSAF